MTWYRDTRLKSGTTPSLAGKVTMATANSDLQREMENVRSEYSDLVQRHEAQIRDNAQLSR